MVKKFLFSTVLTTVVAVSVSASAAEVTQAQDNKQEVAVQAQETKSAPAVKQVKAKQVSKKKTKKHHSDAYSPKHHVKGQEAQKHEQEMVVFAEQKAGSVVEQKKQDALINSDGLAIKVGGNVDIQYGAIDQNKDFRQPLNNSNLPQSDDNNPQKIPTEGEKFTNQHGMTSNGKLVFSATKENHDGNKYGLEIEANANLSPSSSGNPNFAKKSYIFLENGMGRFEAGANDGASETMAVSAAGIAKGTGGIDGDYSNWVAYGATGGDFNYILDSTFLTTPSLPYAHEHAKKANKLTYYTPTFNGFKAGLSYVRDVTVQGTTFEALSFKGSGYKNVIEGGLSYENKFDHVGLHLSATGQIGEARDAYDQDAKSVIQLKRLGAWHVGGKVSYDGFAVAASYGDWGKSGTTKDVEKTPSKKANFWTAGLAYDHEDKGGVSFTYMKSERIGAFSMNALPFIKANSDAFNAAKQKFDVYSVGAEYKVMPGLMPYAEVSRFEFKSNLAGSKVNKGTVVLGGVKVQF